MAFFGSFMREFLQDPFFNTATSFMTSAMEHADSFFNSPLLPARVPRGPARVQQQQSSPFSAHHPASSGNVGRGRRPGFNYFLSLEDAPRSRVALHPRDIKPTPAKRLTAKNRESDSVSICPGADAGPAARSEGHARHHDPELMPAVTVRDVCFHCVPPRNPPAGSGAQERPSRSKKTVTIVRKKKHVAQKSAAPKPELASQEESPKVFRALGWDHCMTQQLEREIVLRNLNVRWDQIAGCQEAKTILQEAMVLPSLMPEFFTGIRRPWKGILMVGPPGTGKTMLAKAVATECDSTFFNVSSSVLTSKYRGDSEKIVRLLFDMAKFYAPSTIFFDEVDSLCSVRGVDSEQEASRRFKSELLIQMDGLDAEQEGGGKYITVLAATNHPWDIDDAFRRRFEKRIYIPLPDETTRCTLLNMCLKNLTVEKNTDVKDIARRLKGYSGADITNVCRNSAMMSVRRQIAGRNAEEIKKIKKEDIDLPVTAQDFEEAVAKCKASVSRKVIKKYEHWMSEYESC